MPANLLAEFWRYKWRIKGLAPIWRGWRRDRRHRETRASGPCTRESHEILVIDHDGARREAIAATLREEGFPVTALAEGLAGLRAICQRGFALVIAAMGLPGTLDGVATMRQARGKQPDLKFLLVADYPRLPLWLSRMMPDEVIAAPFHRWELIGCVFELLERDTRDDMLDLSRRARTERWAS